MIAGTRPIPIQKVGHQARRPTVDQTTILLGIAALVAAAYGAAHAPLALQWQPPRSPLLLLVAIGLGVRCLFLALFPNPGTGDTSFDVESYRIVANLLLQGSDVYAETARHPYLPFHMYWFAFSALLEEHAGGSFFFWVRLPHILADIGILLIVYHGSLKLGRSQSTAFSLALLWAVQPVSIYQSVLHGQFHSVSIFFALLAWYLLKFQPSWRGALGGGLALGFAIVDHSWPVILVPVLVLTSPNLTRRTFFVLGAMAVPFTFVLFYMATVGTTTELLRLRALEHDPTAFRFGYSYLLHETLYGIVPIELLAFLGAHSRELLYGALAIVGAIVIPRRDAMTAAVVVIATVYAFSYSMGNQQLLWIIPFALLAGQVRMLAVYSAVLTIGLLIYYWGTCGLVCPGYLRDATEWWSIQWVWPISAVWMAREVVRALQPQTRPEHASEPSTPETGSVVTALPRATVQA